MKPLKGKIIPSPTTVTLKSSKNAPLLSSYLLDNTKMSAGAFSQTKTNHTGDFFFFLLFFCVVLWSLCAIIASLHILYVQGPLLCSFSDIHLIFKINFKSPGWQDMWLKPSKLIKLCVVLELSWEGHFSWGGLNCLSAISSGAQLVEVVRWMILYSIQ